MNKITSQLAQFQNKSIWSIKDHIPSVRKPQYASYDNKPLSKWDADNFADYVLDQCDMKNTLQCDNDCFLRGIDMLNYIPESYARIYLYGVWSCIDEVLRVNKKLNHN